ncbi:SprT-like domain-containing protein [Kistimonas asteriae]|uniref:SprT-like domain-containing protein n=1 Tax=Kistimonas asteriae TaxID=517724 RepID=UPI001BAD2A5D|nr:SprT-like domain-containing protein [Kistimonas asteriae]
MRKVYRIPVLRAVAVSQIEQDINRRIHQLIRKASHYYDIPFPPPIILMDLLGSDAGQALPGKNRLRFNPALYRQNPTHFVHHIVAHEVAHLIAAKVYGHRIKPHGKEWQAVMTLFQVPPERCHNYDIRHAGRHHFIYGCDCPEREIPLTAIRHNRIQRGVKYHCQHCGSALAFRFDARNPRQQPIPKTA